MFYKGFTELSKTNVCNHSDNQKDNECVVLKDGHQICGSQGIGNLCNEMIIGFYLSFMGTVIMAGIQVMKKKNEKRFNLMC